MRAAAIALLSGLLAASVHAQILPPTPTPTPLPNNCPIGGSLATIVPCLNINQGTTGPAASSPNSYNQIVIDDASTVSGDAPLHRTFGLSINMFTGGTGAAAAGAKITAYFIEKHAAASATTFDRIALGSLAYSNAPDNTGGEEYGANPASICDTGCNTAGVNGLEGDVAIQGSPAGTAGLRNAFRAVNQGTQQATGEDAAFTATSVGATGLFANGILWSSQLGHFPIANNGTLMYADVAATVENGLDLHLLTFTGQIINATGAFTLGAVSDNGVTITHAEPTIFTTCPSSDPHVAGELWCNGSVLNRSTG